MWYVSTGYVPICNSKTDNGLDFTSAEVVWGLIIDPVEYEAVIKCLYLKGCTPKETFDEMKEVMIPHHLM